MLKKVAKAHRRLISAEDLVAADPAWMQIVVQTVGDLNPQESYEISDDPFISVGVAKTHRLQRCPKAGKSTPALH
jgi:hypothetical protein